MDLNTAKGCRYLGKIREIVIVALEEGKSVKWWVMLYLKHDNEPKKLHVTNGNELRLFKTLTAANNAVKLIISSPVALHVTEEDSHFDVRILN